LSNQDDGTVLSERRGAVEILTLSYPARRNAISLNLREILYERLIATQEDPSCRAIIVRGDGDHFCAGGDMSSFDGVTPANGRLRLQKLHRSIRLMTAGCKPVIAAVEGAALGAGLGMAAACDIIVASRDAKFSMPFTRFGLIPDYGALWTIANRIGPSRTKLLVMSGRTIGAEEAERMGVVDQLAEPGSALDDALALAEEIAGGAPLANEYTKVMLARGYGSLDELLDAEADAQGVLFGTEDFVEGYTAFLERRRPVFKGN
jgi:enoyl-CoA hydratase/carnithine racemase